jgi:hypothetical protein
MMVYMSKQFTKWSLVLVSAGWERAGGVTVIIDLPY